MRILTWLVVIGAAAGVIARFFRVKRRFGPRNVDIRVVAKQQPATQDPDSVEDVIRGATIHYWVKNDSSDNVTVTLENFKKKSTGESRRPLKFAPSNGVDVPPGDRRKIVGIVDVDPDSGEDTTRFKHDIRIAGGAVTDPELEIRRPTRFDKKY